MHCRHFELGMVLLLEVLHVAYWIHVCQLSTSCFMTYFIFWHNMVKCQIFVELSSATMNHSHFKLGMVLLLGILLVAYRIHVHQLSTSCVTTLFVLRHNMVECQMFVAPCGGYTQWAVTHRFIVCKRLFSHAKVNTSNMFPAKRSSLLGVTG